MTNYESTDYNTFLPFIDAPYTFIETSCCKHHFPSYLCNRKTTKKVTIKKLKKKNYDKKYYCTVCDWVYDPTVGDPDSDIAPEQSLKTSPTTGLAPSVA